MKVDELKKTSQLHHAYIVSGSAEHGGLEVRAMLEGRGVAVKGNPDMHIFSGSELKVDDVRDSILPFASLKPISGSKYVIASFSRATAEAQNALLKAVEESMGSTVFFFCVDSAGHLLPTLRSRCIGVESAGQYAEGSKDEAHEFLKETYEKRMARLEKIASQASKTQERAPVRQFVQDLLAIGHAKRFEQKVLRDLLDADKYLRLSGSSVKSILGHLAVSLPRK